MSSYFAHPSAVVDEGANIGDGTKIWHFCHISSGAKIGENSVLGQGCFVGATAVIGNGVKVQNGVSIYDSVVIEDGVFCGPHMVFTNVVNPRAFITRKSEYKETRVCVGASIGAGTVVVCGNTVGRYAFIGAGSVVTRDVLPFALVYGNPARQHGWVGKCGNKLDFDDAGVAVGPDGTGYRLVNGEVSEAE